MRVVAATSDHVEEIIEINHQFRTIFSNKGLRIPFTRYFRKDCVLKEIELGNQFVVREDSEVVGAMGLKMLDKEAYIESLAVKSDRHGRGIGKNLVDFAKRRARKERKPLLTVESFCVYGVKDFYLKCGFKIDSELGEYEGHKCYCFSMGLE